VLDLRTGIFVDVDKKGNYAIKVKGVELKPDPVKPGEPAVFNIYASSGSSLSLPLFCCANQS